jgi:hypothetical protein
VKQFTNGRKERLMSDEKRYPGKRTTETEPGTIELVQLHLPYNPGEEISERLRIAKREYDNARKAKQRAKEGNKELITCIYETFGFSGFYHAGAIQLPTNANVWLTIPDGRTDYQETARLLFNGYVPNFWEILLLVVVGISREAPRATFPLITFLKRSYLRTVYFNGEIVGTLEFPQDGMEPR